ncbi:MAG TPA: hypothetical protein V6D33_12410 [Cyanophyceae cyanobacterium]
MLFENITEQLQQAAVQTRETNRNAPVDCKFQVGDRVYFSDEKVVAHVIGIRFYPVEQRTTQSRYPGFWRVSVRISHPDNNGSHTKTADESLFTLVPFEDEVKLATAKAIATKTYQFVCRGDWKLWFVTPKGELMTTPVAGKPDASEFYKVHIWGDERWLELESAIASQLTNR